MNEALLEVFRHNAWATARLIAFCRTVPSDALATDNPGTYGGILATFNHMIGADGRYLAALSGYAPSWARDRVEAKDLEELGSRAAELAPLWETFLAERFDPDRLLLLDKGAYEVKAGVVLAQALHHGNAHREQICSILTSLGLEPPDIQAWGFADDTGRSRWVKDAK